MDYDTVRNRKSTTDEQITYFIQNQGNFDGISIVPEYQEKFEKLAEEAINYYEN